MLRPLWLARGIYHGTLFSDIIVRADLSPFLLAFELSKCSPSIFLNLFKVHVNLCLFLSLLRVIRVDIVQEALLEALNEKIVEGLLRVDVTIGLQ